MKFRIDVTGESHLCRMRRVENETVSHFVSECKMSARKEYKKRHDNVGRYIYQKLCKKYGFQGAQQWYEHEPDGVIENKKYKILWYFTIQWDTKIEARRPDIVVIDKTKMEVKIVDVTIPRDEWVNEMKVGKIEKYKVLKDGIARIWGMKEVIVIAVVVGALGAISNGFENYIAAIGIEMRVEHSPNHKKQFYWGQHIFRNWYLDAKKSVIISSMVPDSVRPLITCCSLLSQNQLDQLQRV